MFMPISEKCNKKVASCELDDCFESSFIFRPLFYQFCTTVLHFYKHI